MQGGYSEDFVFNVPEIIFQKYRNGPVCFGLFKSSEVADAIFVNIDRGELIKRVMIDETSRL